MLFRAPSSPKNPNSVCPRNTHICLLLPLFRRLRLLLESCIYCSGKNCDKNLLKDLDYLSDFSHTAKFEVYHSLCNNFCPKRLNHDKYLIIIVLPIYLKLPIWCHFKIQASFFKDFRALVYNEDKVSQTEMLCAKSSLRSIFAKILWWILQITRNT